MKVCVRLFLVTLLSVACVHRPVGPEERAYHKEQAVGYYSSGRLIHAEALADQGEGWVKIVRPRGRRYGSKELIRLIHDTGRQLQKRFPRSERLQVADLSARMGGKISRHGSHQNGLDVDLIYLRRDLLEQDPEYEAGLTENFVQEGRLSRNFDLERNWFLLQTLVRRHPVARIFVAPQIKESFCQHVQRVSSIEKERDVLQRLRPWPNHADHMHVRLKCPASSSRCTAQTPPAADAGCST